MFFSWVFPHYLYGCPLWIFQCFQVISCQHTPTYGYISMYKKIESTYYESSKAIMGISKRVSSLAATIRLNWLPLNYVLALQSISWLFRMKLLPSSEVFNRYNDLQSPHRDEQWCNTIYFKPAHDMCLRLQRVYNQRTNKNIVFLQIDSFSKFKKLLLKTAFYEVQDYWSRCDSGRYTYKLLPVFTKKKSWVLNSLLNRDSEKMYYRLSFKQNFLNTFQFSIGTSETEKCRFCGVHRETVDHVFENCSEIEYYELIEQCDLMKINFNYRNVLTHKLLKITTEKFITKYFINYQQ